MTDHSTEASSVIPALSPDLSVNALAEKNGKFMHWRIDGHVREDGGISHQMIRHTI